MMDGAKSRRVVRRSVTILIAALSAFLALFFELDSEPEGLLLFLVVGGVWLALWGGGCLVKVRRRSVDFVSNRLKPAVGWTFVGALTILVIALFVSEHFS